MALLGKIEQYDPEQEEWPQFVERLEQFFEANDLTGDDKANKRRATLISSRSSDRCHKILGTRVPIFIMILGTLP